jgi:hypothetical protein
MNRLLGYVYLGSLSAGTVFAEYEILQLLGGIFVVFSGDCVLATVAAALFRLPEGHERADGFHIRPRKPSSSFVSAVRPSQRQMRRGWT